MILYYANTYATPEALDDIPPEVFRGELLAIARAAAERDGRTIDPATAEVVRVDPAPELEGAEGYPVNMAMLTLTVEAQ